MTDDVVVHLTSPRGSSGVFQAAFAASAQDSFFRDVLDSLPAAIYTTDVAGKITYYNEAAAALWGHRPKLNSSEWCGSWKLFWPDGRSMRHEDCPMAVAVKEQRPIRGAEAIAERPDGTRVPFIPFPTPIYNSAGQFVGAVNLLVDITDRKRAEEAMYRLGVLVESSDDAIVSKSIDGIVMSWNKGAERIFGYLAEEMIGKSIKTIIPAEYHSEEDTILERLRRGERIEHYETIRQCKQGHRIDISLTISPVRDGFGKIIGAAKIARDITERKRFEKQLALLGREAEHRTKNVLATVQAIVHLTRADNGDDFKNIVTGRIQALANVNRLFSQSQSSGAELRTLIVNELSAFSQDPEKTRIDVQGPRLMLEPDAAQAVGVAVHELATNAAKYGALSSLEGRVKVDWSVAGGELAIQWTEIDGPVVEAPDRKGFGTTIIEGLVRDSLKGTVHFAWHKAGLCCTLTLRSDFRPI